MDNDSWIDFINSNNTNSSEPGVRFGPPENTIVNPFDTEKIICLSVILVLTFVGNSIVIVILYRQRHRKASRMPFFILNLCAADILVGIFHILPDIVDEVLVTHKGYDVTCKLRKYMALFVSYLSTYVMLVTVFDRYQAICTPIKRNMTGKYYKYKILGVAYGLAAILAIPQLVIYKMKLWPNSKEWDCLLDNSMKIPQLAYFAVSGFFIPLIFLIVLYSCMAHTIWSAQRDRTPPNPRHPEKLSDEKRNLSTPNLQKSELPIKDVPTEGHGAMLKSRSDDTMRYSSTAGLSRAKTRTFRLMLVVVVAFVLCWTPFFAAHFYWMWKKYGEIGKIPAVFLVLSALNSCCYPFIYLFFNWNAQQMSPCCLRKETSSNDNSSKSNQQTKSGKLSSQTNTTSIRSSDRSNGNREAHI